MDGGGDKPRRHSFRIFPTESKSTRGSFAKFIEESGTNFFLATAIAELFDLPNKPENAIEWFRLYFKQLALKKAEEIKAAQNALRKETDEIAQDQNSLKKTDENAEDQNASEKIVEISENQNASEKIVEISENQNPLSRTDEIREDQNTLKTAILKQESTLVRLRMEQHHLEVQLDELYYEAKHVHTIPPKPSYDEDFRRYRDALDDPRWRIRPDPDVVVFKKDVLVQAMENEGRSKSSRLNIEASLTNQQQDVWATSSLLSESVKADREDYKDYPRVYFGIEEAEMSVVPTDEEFEDDEMFEQNIPVDTDEADRIQLRALLTDGESADEWGEEDDEEDEDQEEVEHFGALKSGRSGKRSGEVKPTPSKSKSKRKIDKPEDEADKGSKKKGKKDPKSKNQKSKVAVDNGGGGDNNKSAVTIPSDSSVVPPTPTESEVTKSGKHGHAKKGKKGKKNRKADLEEEEDTTVVSMPEDPLTLELRPVTPSFWKEDFTLTKGHEKMFDFDNVEEFNYEDVEEEVQDNLQNSGVYSNSRGEKRTRRFQSQIIHDAFFKPDRGPSIEFDTPCEPLESCNPSMAVIPSEGGVEISGVKSPSVVTATISDGTIVARLSKDKSHTKIDEFRAMMQRDKKLSRHSHRLSHK